MPSASGMEWTFDTAASVYEKLRPEYVKKLYQAIFDYAPINGTSRAVEVGIGSGQATGPILKTGCQVTAVEYGENFSRMCREKFQEYPNFSVITGRFESVEFEPDAYDLVFAATSFHWIPEEVGYRKVFSMLKGGGVFARFANHPYGDKGRPELFKEIQKLYAVYMKSSGAPAEYSEEKARAIAELASKYGFEDIRCQLFNRTRTFTAEEYIALLGTYSDHLALEEGKRVEFFSKIQQTIDKFGGEITVYDTIDLQLARKP